MRKLIGVAIVLALVGAACTTAAKGPAPSPPPKPSPRPSPPPDPIAVAINDIQSYWSTEFPALYGSEYEPVPASRIFAAGATEFSIPSCNGFAIRDRDWENNAFYCYGDNFVVFDARPEGLIEQLRSEYGEAAVGAVFAHEWGHAIQDRSGNTGAASVYTELQADCFSGAWVAHVDADGPEYLHLRSGDLDAILAAMLAFRDTPGSTSRASDAHGSGFDRVSSFQDGFENGADACVSYFDDPPLITELPFTTRQELRSGGNIAAEKVLPASVEMINDFYTTVARKDYVPVKIGSVYTFDPSDPPDPMPDCAGEPVTAEMLTNEVFFCREDLYFIVDTVYLQRVYEEIGDFGVTSLMAEPWAGYVLDLQGIDNLDEAAAAQQADCYTGGFAAALFNGALYTKTLGAVQVSPGDLDEAISAFIDAGRIKEVSGNEVFDRVESFRNGFLRGYKRCDKLLPVSSSPAA